jgi:protein-S-isoprenylcysteine O-methyltransferase Ste14
MQDRVIPESNCGLTPLIPDQRDAGSTRTSTALAILLVLPAGVLIHRIFVEEAVLTEVIGRAYADYAARTKRLVPGLW